MAPKCQAIVLPRPVKRRSRYKRKQAVGVMRFYGGENEKGPRRNSGMGMSF